MKIDETELRARLDLLTLEEKVGLLTGADFWTLRPIPKIGLAGLVMSDGPSGVRGTTWDEREPSLLFPNASALAATWDPKLAEATGRLTGAQARDKGVHMLLAPTVNLHRTPLGGRHFENYSEDPLLTSRMATAFVGGVQSAGVAATVKHFVANDSETDRMTYDVRASDAMLRELYLRPFEEAVKGGVWAVMAAYNAVNGATMTENEPLLTGVLKREWGFDGVVVSDWMAVRSTEAAARGGTDLEMPGTSRACWRDKLVEAVRSGRVLAEVVDDKALRVLRLAARTGALDGFAAPNPLTTPADARDRLRALAARASVLLSNDGTLPLTRTSRVALIGPNAVRFAAQGGGSAHVNPDHVVSPAEGFARVFTDFNVHAGVYPHRLLPGLTFDHARDPETGEAGLRLEYQDAEGIVLRAETRHASRLVFMGRDLPEGTARLVARTVYTAREAGRHLFGVTGSGEFRLTLGDSSEEVTLVTANGDPIDAMTNPAEHRRAIDLAAGQEIVVEAAFTLGPAPFAIFGIGHEAPHPPEDEEIAAAVAAARDADVAVVMVGTNDEVESEGMDRTTLALPGRQDELVAGVAAANPRTVVVVNAGSPVLMPWRDEVAAVLWVWLPGQEGGDAIADVLTGAAEPGGRLPTTFPATDDGLPSTVPRDGVLDYSDDDIGYRRHLKGNVAYPFGHGLGYTTWSYEGLSVSGDVAEVTIRNTGRRRGREVVQVYLGEVPKLAGFASVEVGAGETQMVRVALDGRSIAHWNDGWQAPSGTYPLHAGRSVTDLRLRTQARLDTQASLDAQGSLNTQAHVRADARLGGEARSESER